MAKVMGKIMDAKPPPSYQEILAKKQGEQRAREIKAAAEAAVPIKAPERKTGLETRQTPFVPPPFRTTAEPEVVQNLRQRYPEWTDRQIEEAASVVGGHPGMWDPKGLYSVLTGTLVPPVVGEQIEKIPVAGPPLRRGVEALVSPMGLGFAATMPKITAEMLAGQVAAGAATAPFPKVQPYAEMAGAVAGPAVAAAAPAIARGVTRGVEAAAPGARRLATEEAGAVKLPGEEPIPRVPPEVPEAPLTTPATGEGAGAEPPAGARPPSAGGKPPPPPEADSAASMDNWFMGAPASEQAGRTLRRRYEGAVNLEKAATGQELIRARRVPIKISDVETPESGRLIEAMDYQGPAEDAITKLSLNPQETELVRTLRGILDDETAKMQRVIPDWEGRTWYYPHEFVPTEPKTQVGRGIGLGRVGQKPGFMRQRTLEGTVLDTLAERPDLTLKTWNPIETVERRVYRGIIYRNQMVLKQNMERVGLALPASKVAEEGWRVPKIGPAFESRAVPGQPDIYTQPWAVPEDIAKQLEDHFGTSAFNANVPLRVLKEAVATAKFAKTFGGLFQNVDYTTRAIGFATKYRDVAMLGEVPKSLARAYVPGLDAKMRALELKDEVVQALLKHGLNTEAGLGFQGPEFEQMARDLKLFRIPIVGKALKAFGTGSFRNAHNSFVTGVARRVTQARVAAGMGLEEAAAKTALDMNESFSSLPVWQSVFRNPTTRDFMRTGLFSMAEQESWVRMPVRQKMLFASIIVDVVGAANVLNIMFQGKPLSADQYLPFVLRKDQDGKTTGFTYNTHFLRPQLPYKGPLGQEEYLDLLGQADTPMRLLSGLPVIGDPAFVIASRTGQLPSALVQAIQGRETFGGESIKGAGGYAKFVGKQLAPIPAQSPLEEMGRIGSTGAALQVGGVNVMAETYRDLLRRRYEEKMGKKWDEVGPNQRQVDIQADPELRKIQDTAQERGVSVGAPSAIASQTYRTARDEWQGRIATAIQNPQATGADVEGLFSDAGSDLAAKGEVLFATAGGGKPKGALAQGLEQYNNIRVQYVNGLPDFDTYFKQKDALLDTVPGLEAEVRAGTEKRWTDPNVRQAALSILDARQVRKQYYAIPAFVGLTPEEGDQVNDIIARADAMVQAGQVPSRRSAITAMASGYPQKLILYALQAERLRNPERRIFKMQHADALSWFSDLPVEELTTAAIAQ